jgi:hypothetical protein
MERPRTLRPQLRRDSLGSPTQATRRVLASTGHLPPNCTCGGLRIDRAARPSARLRPSSVSPVEQRWDELRRRPLS